MEFFRSIFMLVPLAVILCFAQEVQCQGMQCFRCKYLEQTRIEDGSQMVTIDQNHDGVTALQLPSDHYRSCAKGKVPSDSFVVDCGLEYKDAPEKTIRDHPVPENPFETLEAEVERQIQVTGGAYVSCGAMFAIREWTINGTSFKTENMYRGCYRNSIRFNDLLSMYRVQFPELNITGYSCDQERKCNGVDPNDLVAANAASGCVSVMLSCMGCCV